MVCLHDDTWVGKDMDRKYFHPIFVCRECGQIIQIEQLENIQEYQACVNLVKEQNILESL